MTGEIFFSSLAVISVGFAGFSGLIIAILGPLERKWGLIEANALRLILEFSLALTLICLIPFVLFYIPLDESSIWRIVSLILGIFLTAEFLIQFRRLMTATKKAVFPRKSMPIGFFLPTAVFGILESLNAVLWYKLWVLSIGLLFLQFQAFRQLIIRINGYIDEMDIDQKSE